MERVDSPASADDRGRSRPRPPRPTRKAPRGRAAPAARGVAAAA